MPKSVGKPPDEIPLLPLAKIVGIQTVQTCRGTAKPGNVVQGKPQVPRVNHTSEEVPRELTDCGGALQGRLVSRHAMPIQKLPAGAGVGVYFWWS